MSSVFPVTSATLIDKIRNLGPEHDSAEWVRLLNSYSLAIRQFAAMKGGEENADDIVMQVLAKLVDVLRTGQYSPKKGKFHCYLAMMIVNEVRMAHRKFLSRAGDRTVSLDAIADGADAEGGGPLADALIAPGDSFEAIDAEWRQAVLQSAVEHVLTKTALSERDRKIYRACAIENRGIADVAKEFGITRNNVSHICSRINKRIVDFGKLLVANEI